MRSKVYLLLLSLFLGIGSVEVMAAGPNNHRGQQNYEQGHRDNGFGNKNKKKHKENKKDKHKYDDRRHNPRHDFHPGPMPGMHPGPAPALPPRLMEMVKHTTRGCKDVNVFRVNRDTYVVRYRKGHKIYARYLYPFDNRYGAKNVVTMNWIPQVPYVEIPPIQINLSL